jgi:hypothetical protein
MENIFPEFEVKVGGFFAHNISTGSVQVDEKMQLKTGYPDFFKRTLSMSPVKIMGCIPVLFTTDQLSSASRILCFSCYSCLTIFRRL